jgi:hypothetical protein
MDRREFNSIVLAGGAVAAAGTMASDAVAQTAVPVAAAGSSGFELLRLPEEYRKIFEQSYPRFSDASTSDAMTRWPPKWRRQASITY